MKPTKLELSTYIGYTAGNRFVISGFYCAHCVIRVYANHDKYNIDITHIIVVLGIYGISRSLSAARPQTGRTTISFITSILFIIMILGISQHYTIL